MIKPAETPARALGRALQVLRSSYGYSRKELAERGGISYPYLSEIEAGKKEPSARALAALAQALGIRQHQLLELADRYADGEDPAEIAEDLAPMSPVVAHSMAMPASRSWFRGDREEVASKAMRQQPPRGPLEEAHKRLDSLDDRDLRMVLELLRRLSERES